MASYAGRVIYIKQDHGAASGRYTGFRVASGEYINFLDHDDLMMPTKIERQVQILDSHPEIGLVHCGYYHIDEDGNRLDKISFLPDGTLEELIGSNLIWSGAPLVRRQCLEKVEGYGDWDMWLCIALAGYPFACVQEPLGAYRILQDSQMSNPAMTEHIVFSGLDKVFADPRLPTNLLPKKEDIYKMWRFWISCQYYTAGLWDEAQRNLAKALIPPSELLEHPETLVQLFRDNALNLRVRDPIKFIVGVFDHLPPGVNSISQYRSQTLSQVYIGLALRNYGLGAIATARDQLTAAVTLDPALLEQVNDFVELLTHSAIVLPASTPFPYIDTVLQNLPSSAQRLERARSRVLSNVSVACAFQDYFAGRRRPVIRQVLTALRYRPAWLGNRGVISIFLKSLLGLMDGERDKERPSYTPLINYGVKDNEFETSD
jgi:hypothetical protein